MLDGKKILLLNELSMLDTYKSLFEKTDKLKNTDFFFVETSTEAEAIIKKENPDLLFLDICLIDMEKAGQENKLDCEGTKILKRYGRTHRITTISYAKEDATACIKLGAKWHFRHPVDFNKILETWDYLLK